MYSKILVGLAVGGAAAVTSGFVYLGKKVHQVTQKLNMSLRDISEASTDDIKEDVIERAVQQAAYKKVDKYAKDAECAAMNELRSQIKAQTKIAVDSAFNDIEAEVQKEISSQVANLDHQALKKQIMKEAKEKVLEKFDGSLDDILKDFSDDLNRVKKIHASIADALSMEKKESKTVSFNL